MKANHTVMFLLSLLSFVACDKEEVVIPTAATTRTVLVYIAGDNSLSGYVSQNLRAIKEGIEREGLNDGNLLIYTDEQNEVPRLFQLKLEADTVRQIVLETYDPDQNSASTETLTRILDKVQGEYPADGYGLVLWSHGTGWLPSDVYRYLRSFGQDGRDNFMEINDLSSALSKYHFDFLLFDACYMSCAEVAYAFRGCTDYMIGSPTEIQAKGFPYQTIMGDMFEKEADVVGMATKFYEYYKDDDYPYATISVIKSDALDELVAACRTLFQGKTERDLFAVPAGELQIMEYLTPDYHALYDLDDYVSRLAAGEPYDAFKRSLEKAVIYKAATPKAIYAYPYPGGSYLPIHTYSGLSIYVPQEALPELNEWYKDLEWYKDVYPMMLP
ncbi:clostripain-related cysteine peptidase [Parabacteroides sp. ZJ-118]|uniref:clostripain-related cysteine peptidase n=1 Tax=Parabacteroides sp. ZJ-118 TaxID=2709398 RepID=UPI0013E9C1D8|nr:clostripain-related cysteine peptidase [Parabacteroides sp. ZJ-118]